MSLAAHGAPFLPWGGFFQKMLSADVLLILDDTKMPHGRTWLNRCLINLRGASHVLTVPIQRSGSSNANRKDIRIDQSQGWQNRHCQTIKHAYQKAPHWDSVTSFLTPILERNYTFLFDMNIELIAGVRDYLGFDCEIIRQSNVHDEHTDPSQRLVQFSKQLGKNHYVSGTGATDYLDTDLFVAQGVSVTWSKYHETEYRQVHNGPFITGLSLIDRLFNQGTGALAAISDNVNNPAEKA
ncbi:hypothetical protein GHK39_32845 [Sinorhizobium medicae]|uniref:WbqC family protein n=1 Tax=Sinorhizobium medicae TaxID=110321 RepID=UPI00129791BC|nr:WbqC family protein [Sinorhizobium medicae]MDX0415057.1 hypothetical protein [Sinorhizobium medicae]MDX0476175.1 hypothetical protein [Sinorhizobium medicae]MQV89249.1 hypothetical protein [Sinorhizobium medicae]MQV95833.1 hypothetical protein [Sinorhizobium medicae]